MKNPTANLRTNAGTTSCSGVTLTEVLVSIMIMSIGVILLSTLLPISILRTAQASQLTQAVFLRNNAEALIESNIGLLSNSAPAGILPNSFAVVDPLGGFLNLPAAPFFGGLAALPRSPGAATTLVQAENLAQLPDSWTTVAEGTVTANLAANPPNVVLASPTLYNVNVRNSVNPQFAPHRLVMSDITGKFAVVEPLSQVTGNTLSWWDPNNTLANPGPSVPNGFIPVRARIEARERRFTWLMTVKKYSVSAGLLDNGWAAEINVAVFFNRSFNSNEELPFTVAQVPLGFDNANGAAGVDDDGNGTVDDAIELGWVGSDDNRTVTVSFVAGSAPPLKKGGFMLEPTQLKWYRIINFTPVTPSSTTANVLFDQDIRSTPGNPITRGIFLKGIIDVYSLGVRTGQQ